jgi:hypothetical protein
LISCLFHSQVRDSIIEEHGVDVCLMDKRSIAGADETSMQCNPKLNKVVGDLLYGSEVQFYGDPKKAFTVMFTSLASGEYINPAILYPYLKSIPPNVLNGIDKDFFEFSGGGSWMTGDLFKWWLLDVSEKFSLDQFLLSNLNFSLI